MRHRHLIAGALAIAALAAASCRKLDAPITAPEEPRTVTLQAVPAEMGELLAVTSAPEWPHAAQLWFVKPDKTISMVAVDMKSLRLSSTVVLIPRQ